MSLQKLQLVHFIFTLISIHSYEAFTSLDGISGWVGKFFEQLKIYIRLSTI